MNSTYSVVRIEMVAILVIVGINKTGVENHARRQANGIMNFVFAKAILVALFRKNARRKYPSRKLRTLRRSETLAE